MNVGRFAKRNLLLAIAMLAACSSNSTPWPPDSVNRRVLEPRLSQPLAAAWMEQLGPVPLGKSAELAWVQMRINRVPFRTDKARWGVEDYWASPEEFLRGGGDCEDYALAKMAMLRSLGWPEADLELVVVADMAQGGRTHAVLRARLNGADWLLDNQSAGLRPAARETRYLPLQGYGAGI